MFFFCIKVGATFISVLWCPVTVEDKRLKTGTVPGNYVLPARTARNTMLVPLTLKAVSLHLREIQIFHLQKLVKLFWGGITVKTTKTRSLFKIRRRNMKKCYGQSLSPAEIAKPLKNPKMCQTFKKNLCCWIPTALLQKKQLYNIS